MIRWICPLEVEQAAALEMLDEEHERLPQSPVDHNVYNLGSIEGHNVVIAGLHQPGNCYGVDLGGHPKLVEGLGRTQRRSWWKALEESCGNDSFCR